MKTTRTRGAPWALVLALTLALAALGLVPTASAADYSIIINSMTNGAVTADKTSANQGETVTLTIAPAEGYELNTLTISKGTSPYISKSGAALSYEFNMPGGNVTVSATFKKSTYNVNLGAVSNGKLTTSASTAQMGGSFKLTTTANNGYELDALTVTLTTTAQPSP